MLRLSFAKQTEMVLDKGVLKLSGDLRLENLSSMTSDQLAALKGAVSTVDCRQLVQADSCTLAFFAYLHTHNSEAFLIQFFPANLVPLVKLYDLQWVMSSIQTQN